MPEHKMIIINGIRVRPEDADRYRAQAPAPARDAADAPAGPIVPVAGTTEQVLTYLATVGVAETERVLAAEAEGKARAGILGKREQLLAAAAERDAAGDGGGGGAAT